MLLACPHCTWQVWATSHADRGSWRGDRQKPNLATNGGTFSTAEKFTRLLATCTTPLGAASSAWAWCSKLHHTHASQLPTNGGRCLPEACGRVVLEKISSVGKLQLPKQKCFWLAHTALGRSELPAMQTVEVDVATGRSQMAAPSPQQQNSQGSWRHAPLHLVLLLAHGPDAPSCTTPTHPSFQLTEVGASQTESACHWHWIIELE